MMWLDEVGDEDYFPGHSPPTCTGMSKNYRREKRKIKKE